MMAALRTQNRQMFWRIVRRLLGANRGRLVVILLALGAGAAVTAALLNLQVDAKRRIAYEFRTLGANIIISPQDADGAAGRATLDEAILDRIPKQWEGAPVHAVPFVYYLGQVRPMVREFTPPERVVLVGTQLDALHEVAPGWKFEPSAALPFDPQVHRCIVGRRVASKLKGALGDNLEIGILPSAVVSEGKRKDYPLGFGTIAGVVTTGGSEDDQVFIELSALEELAAREFAFPLDRVNLIQLSVPGTPEAVERFMSELSRTLPEINVRGVRQLTEGEGKIYGRISGLLSATVVIVLLLTGLCVMAAMTNVAMERRNDVGLMKAIGGATRRVLHLFLAEAALLGLAGGVMGAAAGIFLSVWLGKQVFGVAARPRLIVYPVAVALTMMVAILSAYPLRRLACIRPASVFRGEA
jgi:putative ABC transport system permease protein